LRREEDQTMHTLPARYVPVGAFVALGGLLCLGTTPALAATPTYISPITSGSSDQIFTLGDLTYAVDFGPETVKPDGYTEQYVSVTVSSAVFGFSATVSDDWEFNGSYAYTIQRYLDCTATAGHVSDCTITNNGAQYPTAMVWYGDGNSGIASWWIDVDLYGNGSHSVSDCGPGPACLG
jgi:hypothetical protein